MVVVMMRKMCVHRKVYNYQVDFWGCCQKGFEIHPFPRDLFFSGPETNSQNDLIITAGLA